MRIIVDIDTGEDFDVVAEKLNEFIAVELDDPITEIHLLSEDNTTQFFNRPDDGFTDMAVFIAVEKVITEFIPGVEDEIVLPKAKFIESLISNLNNIEEDL